MIPRIAIIGAGPAGLILARLLHNSDAKFSVTIYEKDESPTSRLQVGGTLDLRTDTGLAAVRAAGLWDEFERYARYDGEALAIADKNATRLINISGDGEKSEFSRPEIDRERLKRILLGSVPEDMIRWNWKLRAVSENEMLEFDNQETEGPFDLIVGADGAWSKVRTSLSDARPHYSGIGGFEMKIVNPNQDHPEASAMVGRGSLFAYSDLKGIIAQRMGDESIKVSCWLKDEETYPEDVISQHGRSRVQEELLKRYAGWAPELLNLLKSADAEYAKPWPLYELPVGHNWTHKKGLTLVGDAASLMTPFAGEGVNKAMKDALELAEAILGNQDGGLDAAVSQYEHAMFPRSAKTQAQTMKNKTAIYKADAPLPYLMSLMDQWADITAGTTKGRVVASWPVRALAYSYFWTRMTVGALVRQYWLRT